MLKLGSTEINKIYLGQTEINKIYLGADEVFGGGAVPTPLRTVAIQNRPNKVSYNNAASDRYGSVAAYKIVTATKTLVLNFSNFRLSGTRPVAANNEVTISSILVEINGYAVPFTFSEGRSRLLGTRATDENTEEIPASAFGYDSVIPAGTVALVRWITAPPTLGGHVLFEAASPVAEYSGQQAIRWNTANTIVDESDYSGPFVVTSGAAPSTSTGIWQKPMLLGRPVVDGPSFMCVGDSIADYVGDTSQGITGRGFFQRAMALGTELPSINMAVSGSVFGQLTWDGETDLMKPYAKYCRYVVDEMGTNNISTNAGATIPFMTDQILTYYAWLRDEGIEKIFRTKLMCNTSSADNWTTSTQTIAAEWGVGQRKDQLNDWFEDYALANGIVDYVVQMDAVRYPAEYSKWNFDGTNNRYTTDGTHPSPYGHGLMAIDLRAVIDALIA